jgi:hypothetical protein
MRFIASITILLVLTGLSCEDDGDDSHLVIKTGKACGWCAGADSLVMTRTHLNYEFAACDESKNKNIDESTNHEEWRKLLRSLDWNAFKRVDVNTCALCADGCDTWIVVENNKESHQIRFTENSPEIEPVRAFVEKVRALHEKYR